MVKTLIKKALYIVVPAALLALFMLHLANRNSQKQVEVSSSSDKPGWVWENPYTFKKVTIPGQWQKTQAKQVKDTLLALEHESGKSVVYIVYETSEKPMSLKEYVKVMKKANTRELGTSDFEKRSDKDGREYYYAGGAKYFGDELVNTRVRIWSDKADHFWRMVSMTNGDYEELDYDAKGVEELLYQTTL